MDNTATIVGMILSIISILGLVGTWIAFITKLKQELKAHLQMDDQRFETMGEKIDDIEAIQKEMHKENLKRLDSQTDLLRDILREVKK